MMGIRKRVEQVEGRIEKLEQRAVACRTCGALVTKAGAQAVVERLEYAPDRTAFYCAAHRVPYDEVYLNTTRVPVYFRARVQVDALGVPFGTPIKPVPTESRATPIGAGTAVDGQQARAQVPSYWPCRPHANVSLRDPSCRVVTPAPITSGAEAVVLAVIRQRDAVIEDLDAARGELEACKRHNTILSARCADAVIERAQSANVVLATELAQVRRDRDQAVKWAQEVTARANKAERERDEALGASMSGIDTTAERLRADGQDVQLYLRIVDRSGRADIRSATMCFSGGIVRPNELCGRLIQMVETATLHWPNPFQEGR